MARRLPSTWESRLGTEFGHPASSAAAVTALALASFVAVRRLAGTPLAADDPAASVPLEPSAISGIVLCFLLGYMIFGNGILALARDREIARVGAAELRTPEIARAALRRSRFWGALGAAFGLITVLTIPGTYGVSLEDAHADYAWFLVAGPLFLWLLARAGYLSLRSDETLGAIRAREIDLLDLEPVRLFGRLGVQSALVWLVGTSIAAPMLLGLGLNAQILPVMIATIGVAVLSIARSVHGLGARIREKKRSELERIDGALRAARAEALEGGGTPGRLADLLAYRSFLESIRESALGTSTLLRLAAYLLIPLGSWFASALVERFVNTVLG